MMEFSEALEAFKRYRQNVVESSERTVTAYETHVQSWHEYLQENDKTVWDADTDDLRGYAENLKTDDKAPGAIGQRVSAISSFYGDLDRMQNPNTPDNEEMPENPYDGFTETDRKTYLNGDTKKKEGLAEQSGDTFPYLTPEEVDELVQNVPAPRLRNSLIIKLLFNCGFRRGELATVKIAGDENQINRSEKSISIPPMKSAEYRTVAYSSSYLGFELTQWLDKGGRASEYYAEQSDYLFPTQQNEHIPGDGINKIVKRAAENASLQEDLAEYSDGRTQHKVTAHTLRHSFAMNAINNGINVKTLQTLMGHQKLDTTLVYLQQSKDEALEASRKIDCMPHE